MINGGGGGVQIRIKLNEKRTVPHRRGEAKFCLWVELVS